MEQLDQRLKYVDINQVFNNRSNDIRLKLKQSNRACEELAKVLAKSKPRDAEAFEKVERLKEYVIKTSSLNDEVIQFLEYVHGLLSEIGEDSKVLIEGAVIRDKLLMQSETIELLISQREDGIKSIYDIRKNQINTQQPG